MTPLRAQMIRDMQLQRLAPQTQKAYVTAVAGLAKFYQCSPDRLRPEQIRTYLHHLLTERRLAWSSCNQAAAGLKFFYTKTLGWDVLHRNLPPRTGRSQLPQVLSIEALQRLFTRTKNPRHRALLMTTYAAGLRVSEVVRLRLTDIESDRMLVRVEQGKGRKDRYTLLSTRLLTELRAYWKLYRPALWLFTGLDPHRPMPIGGHAEHCPTCGFERYAYHSCRHRHCPKCQTFTKAQWIEERKAALLPVPSFHLVFTVPHALNALILVHKRPLLTLLCNAASQTLVQFGHRNLGGQVGCTMVLHTWDQTLGAHFHVHCVIAAGALAANGERWIEADPRFLFPVRALSTVFRGKFCAALAQASSTGAVLLSEGCAQLRDQLYAHEWVVYAKAPFADPAQVLDYVGRYTHRVAIANHRLLDVRDGCVRFAYRNRRQGNRVQTMTLDADEFIRRFLLHVLPRGFMRLRHDGFLANRHKARTLRRCRELLGQPSEPPPRRAKSVVQWMQEVTGIDLTQCPHCGARPLLRRPLAPLSPPGVSRGTPVEVPIYDSS